MFFYFLLSFCDFYFQARFNRGDVDVGNSKIRNLQKDVDGVKSVMTENIGILYFYFYKAN